MWQIRTCQRLWTWTCSKQKKSQVLLPSSCTTTYIFNSCHNLSCCSPWLSGVLGNKKDSPKMSHMKGAGCIWLPCFRSTGNKQAAGKALHHSSQSVQSTLQKHTACASHRSARATPSTENSLGFIPRPSSRVSQFSPKTDLVVFWGTNFSPPTGGFRYTSCIIPADLSWIKIRQAGLLFVLSLSVKS